MKVGQYIYLKASTSYAQVHVSPSVASEIIGYTTGFVGEVIEVDVDGYGDGYTYTKLKDNNGEIKYLNNSDVDLFDFKDESPTTNDNEVPTTPTTPTTPSSGGTTLDKIATIFGGLFSIFNKTQATKPAVKPTTPSDTGTGAGEDETPTPSNEDKGFGEWFGKNWYWSVPLMLLIPGGIIWAIIASVKKSKAKTLAVSANSTTQKPK